MGRDGVVGIATRYGLGDPRVESRGGGGIFAPAQTGPRAYLAFCEVGNGSISRGKAAGVYRTANLQMLHFIYYSTNIRTEYFKHAADSQFFSSKDRLFHNATFFGSCVIHILYTECAKIKKKFRRQRVKETVGL